MASGMSAMGGPEDGRSRHAGALVPADAATLILLRKTSDGPACLMGRRRAGAAFMPSKFVFPGGRVDPADHHAAFATPLSGKVAAALSADTGHPDPTGLAHSLAAAAIRELSEETGLRLTRPGASGPTAGDGPSFLAHAAPLAFVFRAVTPAGPPRRFDARFLLADAADLAGDPDDLSSASGELSHLAWVPLAATRELDLPFITEIVLAEVAHRIATGVADPDPTPDGVPFFDNRGPVPRFTRIV